MTLLDAPAFDNVRDRRNRLILFGSGGLLVLLFVGWWLVAGMPVDWPWTWNSYLRGTSATNGFLTAVEKSDLPKAYGIWIHDKDWQQHPAKNSAYPFPRFQQDWSSTGEGNEYGSIQSHKIVAQRIYGNVVVVASRINGRKSKELFLAYDTKAHTLGFSPVELYLGP